jgi:hypothetical protein
MEHQVVKPLNVKKINILLSGTRQPETCNLKLKTLIYEAFCI